MHQGDSRGHGHADSRGGDEKRSMWSRDVREESVRKVTDAVKQDDGQNMQHVHEAGGNRDFDDENTRRNRGIIIEQEDGQNLRSVHGERGNRDSGGANTRRDADCLKHEGGHQSLGDMHNKRGEGVAVNSGVQKEENSPVTTARDEQDMHVVWTCMHVNTSHAKPVHVSIVVRVYIRTYVST
jgi:hypothetical protein